MTAEPGQVTWAGCEPNIISHFPHFLFSYCKPLSMSVVFQAVKYAISLNNTHSTVFQVTY